LRAHHEFAMLRRHRQAAGPPFSSAATVPAVPVGLDQLRRLEHLRGLLPSQRVDQPPKLMLFSRTGFTAAVADEAAACPDVELIGIDRLYGGS
jgi:hypothetical protein